MRDDPIDLSDARFIVRAGRLTRESITAAIACARLPASPEVREQFALASRRLLAGIDGGSP